jgi:hypothetical protein
MVRRAIKNHRCSLSRGGTPALEEPSGIVRDLGAEVRD